MSRAIRRASAAQRRKSKLHIHTQPREVHQPSSRSCGIIGYERMHPPVHLNMKTLLRYFLYTAFHKHQLPTRSEHTHCPDIAHTPRTRTLSAPEEQPELGAMSHRLCRVYTLRNTRACRDPQKRLTGTAAVHLLHLCLYICLYLHRQTDKVYNMLSMRNTRLNY